MDDGVGFNTWMLAAVICLAVAAGGVIWPCLWRACMWVWMGNLGRGHEPSVGLYHCLRCRRCSIGSFRSMPPWEDAGEGGNIPTSEGDPVARWSPDSTGPNG